MTKSSSRTLTSKRKTFARRSGTRPGWQKNRSTLSTAFRLEVQLENQIEYLEGARDRRTRISAELTEKVVGLREARAELEGVSGRLDEARGRILGLEGRAGRTWWQAVNLLLPERFRFAARSRNPAKDEFNCLLNYAYGVLYGTVERACILAGLDPYVGFVHTDHYNKPSLVFDLIECYRIWGDETVIGLFTARDVKQEMFDRLANGLTLSKPGKAVLMERFGAHLSESIRHAGRNVQRREAVQLDCHRFANELLDRPLRMEDGDGESAPEERR